MEQITKVIDMAEMIKAEVKKNKPKIQPPNKILEDILSSLEVIDHVDMANTTGYQDFKMKPLHYRINVTETVLKELRKRGYTMCQNENGNVFLYTGSDYRDVKHNHLKKFLWDASIYLGVPPSMAKDQSFRDLIWKQLQTDIQPKPDDTEDTRTKLNLANGTLIIDRKNVELKDFSSNDFFTYTLDYEYDEAAIAPIFDKYLRRVLPDEDARKVIQEYIGLILIPHANKNIKIEKCMILYGPHGHNGKSVLFDILNALFGRKNVINHSLNDITTCPYHRADLDGKYLNICSEMGGKLVVSIFKQIVSGEPISVRYPFEKPFISHNYARLMFNSNVLPQDVEHSHAFFRRFIIVPFIQVITQEEKDVQLSYKIIDNELSGVLNWALEGRARILKNKKFTESNLIDDMMNQFQGKSNSVKLWLDDKGYSPSDFDYITVREAYGAYKAYCLENGYRPLKNINFQDRILALGIIITRRNVGKVILITQKER